MSACSPAPSKVIVETKPVQLDKATADLIRAKLVARYHEPAEPKISAEQAQSPKFSQAPRRACAEGFSSRAGAQFEPWW